MCCAVRDACLALCLAPRYVLHIDVVHYLACPGGGMRCFMTETEGKLCGLEAPCSPVVLGAAATAGAGNSNQLASSDGFIFM